MPLLQKLLIKLNGLHYPQEYLCLAKGSFQHPLHVYLANNTHVLKDITNQHLFVGYCPLVLAFPEPLAPVLPRLIFSDHVLVPNEPFSKKDALAFIELKELKKQGAGRNSIYYYEGTRGGHHFLPGFRQFIGGLINEWYNKKPGNVFLHNNLYKQVQVAYAVPRTISLITVGSNGLFNLFPTDLHGQVDEGHYIISLRSGGKACEQAEAAGKLLLSELHAGACKMVYGLGKNHMQELKPADHFPFSGSFSNYLQWPLPQQAISYRELVLLDSFIHGIHKILLFRIVAAQQPEPGTDSLAHIHNSYASWLYKRGQAGNYLLR